MNDQGPINGPGSLGKALGIQQGSKQCPTFILVIPKLGNIKCSFLSPGLTETESLENGPGVHTVVNSPKMFMCVYTNAKLFFKIRNLIRKWFVTAI